ncbi:DNA mismatch repair protein MutS [Sporanaerobium hydrogeniformans]|uniref:DNA mismatch repair protein MutS n=2 Tax=Sporanaerobium hydrogeniformans TaxID=3072179 RepID=A0AC61DCM7_9FIRM|nr:DNA mismatch repair protein MutS [Sporanaerobium hydrogeniformans]
MMKQYLEMKEAHKECILFFRLGDFYEMFFDDALTASRELEITLTGRDCGLEERAPMCGVPFHAADTYISRLVEKGYKVAICEQVEDPKAAKGLVKRDIVRIVTPGTLLEGNSVAEGKNNYIAAIVSSEAAYGLSISDVTTGEWRTTLIQGENDLRKLLDELAKFAPVECLISENCPHYEDLCTFLQTRFNALVEKIPPHCLDETLSYQLLAKHFGVLSLEGIGLYPKEANTLAASCLLHYLKETQKNELSHMHSIELYNVDTYMLLDLSTRRNLELTETLREKRRKGSLLWVLDQTQTAMGARFLRKSIEQPLINAGEINRRLEATKELVENALLREDLMEALKGIYDLERLMSKVAYGTCNAKDLLAIKQSLGQLPLIKTLLSSTSSLKLKDLGKRFDLLEDIFRLINHAIHEEAPLSLREGHLIKEGYHQDVDHLRQIKARGSSWLMDIETREKEKTGIKNLKIKYNKVFGYFLEVTQSYNHLVPDYFIRKQTLANCERYITEELKKVEDEVLGADDKLTTLEYQIFTQIREDVLKEMNRLLAVSAVIAELDLYCSFAEVAHQYDYTCPTINEGSRITIEMGRHPVVEKMMGDQNFIANDVELDGQGEQIMLLTGPNMAGKSTYMRQVALIVLMAQMGSFIPAKSATIGVVDRIFTRVGASDDLASGQSTFMVEMMEVSNILHNATPHSLLILDEIGRGTSTLDGLSIAWSIIEHISSKLLGAKTLFATHYHELTALESTLSNIKNYCVAVKEVGEDIIFLHKIIAGSVDHSYGIQVAKLAGVPSMVLDRAKAILKELEQDTSVGLPSTVPLPLGQTSLFQIAEPPTKGVGRKSHKEGELDTNKLAVLEELKGLDIMELTPLKAMQVLYDLQKKVKAY